MSDDLLTAVGMWGETVTVIHQNIGLVLDAEGRFFAVGLLLSGEECFLRYGDDVDTKGRTVRRS